MPGATSGAQVDGLSSRCPPPPPPSVDFGCPPSPKATPAAETDKADDSDATAEEEAEASDSSASASAPDSDVVDAVSVSWALPEGGNSLLHFFLIEEDSLPLSVCRRSPFVFGATTGYGLAAAEATGRAWCPRCAVHLPQETKIET